MEIEKPKIKWSLRDGKSDLNKLLAKSMVHKDDKLI
jgi:hypothetical protein